MREKESRNEILREAEKAATAKKVQREAYAAKERQAEERHAEELRRLEAAKRARLSPDEKSMEQKRAEYEARRREYERQQALEKEKEKARINEYMQEKEIEKQKEELERQKILEKRREEERERQIKKQLELDAQKEELKRQQQELDRKRKEDAKAQKIIEKKRKKKEAELLKQRQKMAATKRGAPTVSDVLRTDLLAVVFGLVILALFVGDYVLLKYFGTAANLDLIVKAQTGISIVGGVLIICMVILIKSMISMPARIYNMKMMDVVGPEDIKAMEEFDSEINHREDQPEPVLNPRGTTEIYQFAENFNNIYKVLNHNNADLVKQNKRLTELSSVDYLTGVHNRASFEKFMDSELSRNKFTNDYLGLLMLDVDKFKNFNDNFGHQAGDQVLVTLGEYLMKIAATASGFAARYGGEEFVIVLPDTTVENVSIFAEKVLEDVRNLDISENMPELTGQHVTVSIGSTVALKQKPVSREKLIKQADAAMYEAKEAGRDRHVASDAENF